MGIQDSPHKLALKSLEEEAARSANAAKLKASHSVEADEFKAAAKGEEEDKFYEQKSEGSKKCRRKRLSSQHRRKRCPRYKRIQRMQMGVLQAVHLSSRRS